MRVFAINGSARKDGNTALLIKEVFSELNKEGIETEMFQLSGKKLRGCIACYKCFQNKDRRCSVKDDVLNDLLAEMEKSEGFILGSPTYFSDVTSSTRAFIERCGFVARANDFMFKRKVGSGVIAVRRAGAIPALSSISLFLHYMQMINPGSSYWNVGIGRDPGEVLNDAEGIQTMQTLGQNMAWLLKKLNA